MQSMSSTSRGVSPRLRGSPCRDRWIACWKRACKVRHHLAHVLIDDTRYADARHRGTRQIRCQFESAKHQFQRITRNAAAKMKTRFSGRAAARTEIGANSQSTLCILVARTRAKTSLCERRHLADPELLRTSAILRDINQSDGEKGRLNAPESIRRVPITHSWEV